MHIDLKNRSAILLVAFAVACVSAWLTINGMTARYKEVISTIIITMLVLEASKITIAGWLIIGRHTSLKYPLAIIMAALMTLSLFGHFGYFTDAYTKKSVHQVSAQEQSNSIESKIQRYEQELAQIQTMLQKMPDNYVTKRAAMYDKTAPRRAELNSLLDSLYTLRSTSVNKELQTEVDVGPFRHIATLLGMHQETVARLISMWLALIIDPLALLLIMAGVKKTEGTDPKDGKEDPKPVSDKPETEAKAIEAAGPLLPQPKLSKYTGPELFIKAPKHKVFAEDVQSKPLTDTKTLIIAGNPLDGVYKLAPAIQSEHVNIHLSPSNHYLESLCKLIPGVEEVFLEDSVPHLKGTFLITRPSTDGHANQWAPQQYSQRAGMPPIPKESWVGALTHKIPAPANLLKGTYINLSDRNAEQLLKKAMIENGKDPNDTMTFFHHLDTIDSGQPPYKPDFQLIPAADTGMAYQKRLLSLGPVSATFELLGIPFTACQGQLSEKVASMYRADNSSPLLDTAGMLAYL